MDGFDLIDIGVDGAMGLKGWAAIIFLIVFVVFAIFLFKYDSEKTEARKAECDTKHGEWVKVDRDYICVKQGSLINK